MKHFARAALRTVLIFAAMSAAAQTTPLTSLSVDDLLNVEVTSVARHGQKLSETTAAVPARRPFPICCGSFPASTSRRSTPTSGPSPRAASTDAPPIKCSS